MKHLLSIDDLDGADGIEEVMRLTDSFMEVSQRQIPKRFRPVSTTLVQTSACWPLVSPTASQAIDPIAKTAKP